MATTFITAAPQAPTQQATAAVTSRLERILAFLTQPHRKALAVIPEHDRAGALVEGRVPGINAVDGVFIVAVSNAAQRAWLEGLFALRRALLLGLDINRAREILDLIHAGIDAELRLGRPAFVRDLFKPSTLALARWCETLVNYPWVRVLGVETEIVAVEQRQVAELRDVFGMAFRANVPPEGPPRDAYLDDMLRTATDEGLPSGRRAWALVSMAGIALDAGDLPAAVRLVGQAVELAPTDDAAGTSAAFLWVVLSAAARETKLVSRSKCPAWGDVVSILRGALGCEGRHPNETAGEVVAFNERQKARERGR